ncbi:predicted protein [Uncinocarpus reesii 1704]|uniref:Uncharacterized protein n=1 Tax=Uncinocarpus reesii (strain UAMH 1704) TaxID=336963 RepID=C4JRZ5_UNCRE|nr:uncharacterized protein UREG_05234 [Uncinocarpus reesii 1704]EEP80392.1 predicted protein [Uncinocarpus reesii 1704]
MASSNRYRHSRSSRQPGWPPELSRLDQDVEEIQREFPPGSQYQQWVYPDEDAIFERRQMRASSPFRHYPSRPHDTGRRGHDRPEPYRRPRPHSSAPRSSTPRPLRRHHGDQAFDYPSPRRHVDAWDDDGYDRSHDSSRSRHDKAPRSGQRGSFGKLASVGVLAAAGKTAYDYYRSRSGDRDTRLSRSSDRFRSLSRGRATSVSGYSRRDPYHISDDEDRYDRYDSLQDYPERPRSLSLPDYEYLNESDGRHSGYSSDSNSSSGSSADEALTRRKLRRKELVTAGLATVATIHAGHSLYESHGKRKERLRKLSEGKISPEEARKQRLVGNLKDAASLSLAAVGIKQTIDGWREAAKNHSEYNGFNEKCKQRARERARKRASSMDSGW